MKLIAIWDKTRLLHSSYDSRNSIYFHPERLTQQRPEENGAKTQQDGKNYFINKIWIGHSVHAEQKNPTMAQKEPHRG